MRHGGAGIEQQVAMTFAMGYLSYYTANAPANVSGEDRKYHLASVPLTHHDDNLASDFILVTWAVSQQACDWQAAGPDAQGKLAKLLCLPRDGAGVNSTCTQRLHVDRRIMLHSCLAQAFGRC